MGVGDLTLNIMSLGGLALGIGMLVDNAIVMLENIDRHQRDHPDALEAAHVGAGEVASAVTASTFTNLAAVVPFFLLGGLTALLFNELLLTISFAILTSLVVALTLVPMLSAQLFRFGHASRLETNRVLRIVPSMVTAWRGSTGVSCPGPCAGDGPSWSARSWPSAASIAGFGRLGEEFLPPVDDGRLSIYLRMPPETPLEVTVAGGRAAERAIRDLPHVVHVFAACRRHASGAAASSFSPTRISLNVELRPGAIGR